MPGLIAKPTAVRSVAHPTVQRVAQDGTTAEIRNVNPQLVSQVILDKVVVHVEERDACVWI